MQPELIADYQCETGEDPLWHPIVKRLYWVDIPAGRMFRYDPTTGRHEQCYEGDVIGGFTVQADSPLLLFMDRGAVKIWRDGELTTVLEDIPEECSTRFNDVIAQIPQAGSSAAPCSPRPGRAGYIAWTPTAPIPRWWTTWACPTGLGFTLDHKQVYYTDFTAQKIYRSYYDGETGDISNQQVFVDVPPKRASPMAWP